jgi:hypothetical protein
MQRLELKPTHKPVQNYYSALRQFDDLGVTHETAVRSAFQGLLDHCARQHDWTLVPEWEIRRPRQHPLCVDGTLLDNFRLTQLRGWEKDHAMFDWEWRKLARALRPDARGREKAPSPKL